MPLPVFEALCILLVLLIGGSIVWSTLTLGISPMPSSKQARQAMLQLMDELEGEAEIETESRAGSIVELGSGWGNLLIPLAKAYPQRSVVGYELSPIPWLVSLILKKLLGLSNLQVHRQNFLQADLNETSVILCYLFPGGMQVLEDKLKAEGAMPEYLISNNFALPSHAPCKTLKIDDFYRTPVYLYALKALGNG